MPKRDSDLGSKLRRIRYSIASTGLRRGLADTATLLLSYHPDRDTSFDREFGTDTAGSVAPANLGIGDETTRAQAILYLPSPASVTRWMLKELGIDHRQYSFVDLGCGKGRVLLVASEYPFRGVIGVEISSALAAIARTNIERYRPRRRQCASITVENVDVMAFEFPSTPLVLHLYHPFEPPLTEAVLARLGQSLRSSPRPVIITYLLYASAEEPVEAVFARFPWLRKTRQERSVLGQYNWLFYSN